jgi:hypothetical protein
MRISEFSALLRTQTCRNTVANATIGHDKAWFEKCCQIRLITQWLLRRSRTVQSICKSPWCRRVGCSFNSGKSQSAGVGLLDKVGRTLPISLRGLQVEPDFVGVANIPKICSRNRIHYAVVNDEIAQCAVAAENRKCYEQRHATRLLRFDAGPTPFNPRPKPFNIFGRMHSRRKDPARYPLSSRIWDMSDGCGHPMYALTSGKRTLYKWREVYEDIRSRALT